MRGKSRTRRRAWRSHAPARSSGVRPFVFKSQATRPQIHPSYTQILARALSLPPSLPPHSPLSPPEPDINWHQPSTRTRIAANDRSPAGFHSSFSGFLALEDEADARPACTLVNINRTHTRNVLASTALAACLRPAGGAHHSMQRASGSRPAFAKPSRTQSALSCAGWPAWGRRGKGTIRLARTWR